MTRVECVEQILEEDFIGLDKAQESYGDSWKKRGGVGAFMMLARKWDRIELQTSRYKGDLLLAIEKDFRVEGIIDDVRDLRRYLILVFCEVHPPPCWYADSVVTWKREQLLALVPAGDLVPSYGILRIGWDNFERTIKDYGWDVFAPSTKIVPRLVWLIRELAYTEAVSRERGYTSASRKHRDNG